MYSQDHLKNILYGNTASARHALFNARKEHEVLIYSCDCTTYFTGSKVCAKLCISLFIHLRSVSFIIVLLIMITVVIAIQALLKKCCKSLSLDRLEGLLMK